MRPPIRLFPVLGLIAPFFSLAAQTPDLTIVNLQPVHETRVVWTAQRSPHLVELRNFNPAGDPVLTLLNSSGIQLARARPIGRRLILRQPGSSAGSFIVLVRSRPSVGTLTGELWIDGQLQRPNIQFSAGADTDGDGLSDALEAQLGTCASASGSVPGVECADLADPRDTDGDGLWDGWEVLGFDYAFAAGGGTLIEHLPLPTWGADPRHKDIFLEVDFRRLDQAENLANTDQRMTPAVARAMAAVYADTATTDGLSRTVHAVSVNNPDRRPGISLHFDIGTAPETPADSTLYGDWGGHNAVDAVQDSLGVFRPQAAGAWRQQLRYGREGIFHYVMGYNGGGGQCAQGVACGFNMLDSGNAAHEFGHSLGLDHNGPLGLHEPNCKPNYPSLMNYAYLLSGFLEFSDGSKVPTLNNHALVETGAIDPANGRLLTALRTRFLYRIDSTTGSVDWNRDNVFAPAGTPVRAYANLTPGDAGGCEFTREGVTSTGMLSQRAPAILKFQDRLWVFSVTPEGALAYTYTPAPFACTMIDDCPLPVFVTPGVWDLGGIDGVDAANIMVNGRRLILIVARRVDGTLAEKWMEEVNGLYQWGSTVTIPAAPAAGEPSLAVSSNGTTVVLSYRGQDGIVRYRFRSPSVFQAEQTVMVGGQPLLMPATASPAMAFTNLPSDLTAIGGERLVAAFIDTSNVVQLYTRNRLQGDWSRLGIPYGPMYLAMGRPAMAWVGSPPSNTLVNPSTGGAVTPASDPSASQPREEGRRAVDLAAAEAPAADPMTYGRFYILYIRRGGPPTAATNMNAMRMEMSYVDAAGGYRIGLDSFFDNVWAFGFGIDLLEPGEVALRSATSSAIANSFQQVDVRPHADGIVNLPYRNYDDWRVLGWGSCETLRSVQPAAMQVKCAPKSW